MAGTPDRSVWADGSSALSAANWYPTTIASELAAHEAMTRPVDSLRKQLEEMHADRLAFACVEQSRFAEKQVFAALAAESSALEQIRRYSKEASAAARLGTLASVAGADATLRAFEAATSVAAGLPAFESPASAMAELRAFESVAIAAAKVSSLSSIAGVDGTLRAVESATSVVGFESAASAAARFGVFDTVATTSARFGAFDSVASTVAQLGAFESAASAAARMEILDSAVLARNRALEEMLTPSKVAARYLEEMSGGATLQLAAEQAARWSDPYKDITASLARFNEHLGVSSARALLESMALASAPYGLLSLLEDAAHLPESDEVREEALQLVQGVTDVVSKAYTAQEAVDRIIQVILATKEPQSQRLLFAILVPVLMAIVFSFVNPVADFYVKKWLEGTPKQEAVKQVKEAAREAVGDVRLLSNYRFVNVQRLDLRSGPKAKAPVIGQLRFSQTVRILEKDRDFTLVAWRSEDGKVELQGWVFSRYLRRFT
ncbi:hypothetical protein ASF45_28650 [Pseudorhodoferax sp. Leaf265]|nr:hypothetical protein ASF45_28650 [Pseudorhodoferax sp. Leaf265]